MRLRTKVASIFVLLVGNLLGFYGLLFNNQPILKAGLAIGLLIGVPIFVAGIVAREVRKERGIR